MANEKRLIDANAPWIKRHFTKRLVDVFALVENIEDITWYHVNEAGRLTEGANSNRDIPLFKANDIFSALGSAPTVDAVEVVHGRWIMRGGKRYCSACQQKACVTRDTDDFWYTIGTNYCPNCGADMRGDGNV